jgi:hypothetical protein
VGRGRSDRRRRRRSPSRSLEAGGSGKERFGRGKNMRAYKYITNLYKLHFKKRNYVRVSYS